MRGTRVSKAPTCPDPDPRTKINLRLSAMGAGSGSGLGSIDGHGSVGVGPAIVTLLGRVCGHGLGLSLQPDNKRK
jgi:hypothetical protein